MTGDRAPGGSGASESLVTIGMNYDVLPGKESVFERAFEAVLQAMQGMEGHTRSQLFRDVHSAGSYLIMSEWTSREAFDRFIGSDRFRTVTNWGKEQILAGRPRHQVYRS